MTVHYTNVKDVTEQREKGWHIFQAQGAEKNNMKGAFAFFYFKKNIIAEILCTHLLQLWLKSVIFVIRSAQKCTAHLTEQIQKSPPLREDNLISFLK